MRAAAALALALAATAAAAPPVSVTSEIVVAIDPARRTLNGEARLQIDLDRPATLALGERFEAASVTVDGKPLGEPARREGVLLWALPAAPGTRQVEVTWRGALDPLDTALDHRDTLRNARPVTGADGTFLPSASRWYPEVIGQPFSYRLTLSLPEAQRGLVPGRLAREETRDGAYRATFEFPHPADGIDLMAGPYTIRERLIRSAAGRDIRLRTYFHPRIAELADGYLDALKDYFNLYEGWIGAYPFTEFSVVSSPTPTGFGMPTLTYLGVEVLRLPFIKSTSLGHEVLHNWWGNGVYPDYRAGNWAEGLTTFMADYTYKERADAEAAREMRLSWLRDIAAIPPGQDRPLVEFTSRLHGTSQIVGYHKAAMLFLMLRDRIGRAAFDEGIRRFWQRQQFSTASWDDLRRAFEAASGEDLAPFFEQWLTRAGAPTLTLAGAEQTASGVRIELKQAQPAYRLRVPVTIRTAAGEQTEILSLTTTSASFELKTPARAEAEVLDPDFRLLRRLGPAEAPPILRDAMVNPRTATVIAGGDAALREAASHLAQRMLDYPSPPVERPRGGAPVLLIGVHASVDAWLAANGWPPRPPEVGREGTLQAWTARHRDGPVAVVVSAAGTDALAAAARPLPHYGRQSYLVFDGSRAVTKGVWPAQPQTVKAAPAR
ncbi:MAG TPA: M1 family aminopeptidase [Pelomicrobium sp.]|nr:M1 family aminopeptidase [Pelomicrobium sp.]